MKPLRILLLLIVVLQFFLSCASRAEKGNIVLVIKSYAGACRYTFTVEGRKLTSGSWTTSYVGHVNNIANYDTVTYTQESDLGSKNPLLIQKLITKIQEKSIIDESSASDSFTFEVYLNGKLIRKTTNSDEEIYNILDILLLYVNPEDILCDDFFKIYEEVQKIRGVIK